MKAVVGIFTSREAGERAAANLRMLSVPPERINLLIPGAPKEQLAAFPTSDTEQPGMGKALGGVVGGTMGASGGLLGAAVASIIIPGIGPITAIGLAAAALFGVGGAAAGAAVGGALEESMSEGLPKDELFIYEDALKQGRTVVVALADDEHQAETARTSLAQAGAESLDAARDNWWIGLRDAEAEPYHGQGGDFSQDEAVYRHGFEAALQSSTSGKPYEEVQDYLRTYYPQYYNDEAFRRGYERGQAYYESLQGRYVP
jgi:hypothetical protein